MTVPHWYKRGNNLDWSGDVRGPFQLGWLLLYFPRSCDCVLLPAGMECSQERSVTPMLTDPLTHYKAWDLSWVG